MTIIAKKKTVKAGILKKRKRGFVFVYPIIIALLLVKLFIPGALFAAQDITHDYIIGPQDKLKIEVWDHPDLAREVSVSLTGSFTFPLIGEVKASERTIDEIQEDIVKRLADGYIINPQVTITITDYLSKQVNVLGEVQKPGAYPFTRQTTLVEIISLAGGLTNDAGSEVYILRAEETKSQENPVNQYRSGVKPEFIKEKISLDDMLQKGQNLSVLLQKNDTIYIPRAEFFYVLGEVKLPGQFKLEKDITVLKAISRAGGHTDKANLKKIVIIRKVNDQEEKVHAGLSDTVLANDIIRVPESFF